MSQNPNPPTEQRKTPRYELSAYIDCTGSEVSFTGSGPGGLAGRLATRKGCKNLAYFS